MRKRIIAHVQKETTSSDQDWLNVEGLAEVEVTSEDAAHPIESALLPGRASGWRAAGPGKQTIRLLFNHPQRLRRGKSIRRRGPINRRPSIRIRDAQPPV